MASRLPYDSFGVEYRDGRPYSINIRPLRGHAVVGVIGNVVGDGNVETRHATSLRPNQSHQLAGSNKGEALTSNCVGQRPTLIKQHPYQALKGRNQGMGYGWRPFRAYGMEGIFIVGRCPTQRDGALSGLFANHVHHSKQKII